MGNYCGRSSKRSSPPSLPPAKRPVDDPSALPSTTASSSSSASSSSASRFFSTPTKTRPASTAAPFTRPAVASAASSSESSEPSSSAAMASRPNTKVLMVRLRGILALQARLKAGRGTYEATPKDRGLLMSVLSILYLPEEVEAREKQAKAKSKRRQEAEAAAAEAADSAAFAAMFTDRADAEAAAAAWSTPASSSSSSSSASSLSLLPPALPTECQVCFSEFNTLFEGVLTVRVHTTLCGHASLCAECFATYLRKRIEADDVMPYLGCPEPNCKCTLSHLDIAANVPSAAEAKAFEDDYAKAREQVAARNRRALERKQARKIEAAVAAGASVIAAAPAAASNEDAAAAAVSASSSDDESLSKAFRKMKKSKSKKAAAASGSKTSPPRSHRKSSAASSSSSSDEDSSVPTAPALLVPASASSSSSAVAVVGPPPVPLLSTPLLLQLTLLHLHKCLLQCKDWLPCGTHQDIVAPSATPAVPAAPVAVAAAPASSSVASSAAPAAPASAAPPAAPAAAAASPPACRFGFVLAPSYGVVSKDKLKKCEACGVLQCVKPKTPEGGGAAGDLESMIADGTLRSCPQCECLQMKDVGMCNILQCPSCQIHWNWSSRQTGKNPAALKELARRSGTMWEAGELAYQQRLQREDPEAFKALLARNGIEYNPNYIRGSS